MEDTHLDDKLNYIYACTFYRIGYRAHCIWAVTFHKSEVVADIAFRTHISTVDWLLSDIFQKNLYDKRDHICEYRSS